MSAPSSSAGTERRRPRRRPGRLAVAVLAAAAVAAGAAVGVFQATGGGRAAAEPPPAEPAAPALETPLPPERPGVAGGPPEPAPPDVTVSATVSIVAVGDVVMGSTPNLPPDGGAAFFSAVDGELEGDVVLGNLEGTLSTGGASKCGGGRPDCFAFHTPPTYAKWLSRAGFTVMNLANNHAYDYGPEGLAETVRALRRQGLRHAGRPGQITVLRAGPLRVAVLGFAPYPWAQDLTDIRAARRLVRRAAGRADLVVVTFHGGAEGADKTHVPRGPEVYLGESRGSLRAFAHAVVAAGADLVVGHGPHVLRGMEWYRGRLIAYSMGNFAGYGVFSLGGALGVSGILRVTLRADGGWVRGRLVPTRLAGEGTPAPDPAERAHGLVRKLSREDFGRRAMRVSPTGVLRPPAA